MCEIIKKGNSRIHNNGTDVTILVSNTAIGRAMKASKILGVQGVSTAVIEVLPLASKADINEVLGNNTDIYVFLDEEVHDRFCKPLSKRLGSVHLIEEQCSKKIVKEVLHAIKNQSESNRGFTSNYIHYVR